MCRLTARRSPRTLLAPARLSPWLTRAHPQNDEEALFAAAAATAQAAQQAAAASRGQLAAALAELPEEELDVDVDALEEEEVGELQERLEGAALEGEGDE